MLFRPDTFVYPANKSLICIGIEATEAALQYRLTETEWPLVHRQLPKPGIGLITSYLIVKHQISIMTSQSEHNCYFCKVSRGEADPFIFENRSFVGIFDTNPVNPGHALVIPRRHVASIFNLNETEQADYFAAIRGVKDVIETTDMAKLYKNMLNQAHLQDRPSDHIEKVLQLPFLTTRPNAYTIGNNDGREAGRSIDHLHVILLPRYRGDVKNPSGGIRNVIPSRANYQRR